MSLTRCSTEFNCQVLGALLAISLLPVPGLAGSSRASRENAPAPNPLAAAGAPQVPCPSKEDCDKLCAEADQAEKDLAAAERALAEAEKDVAAKEAARDAARDQLRAAYKESKAASPSPNTPFDPAREARAEQAVNAAQQALSAAQEALSQANDRANELRPTVERARIRAEGARARCELCLRKRKKNCPPAGGAAPALTATAGGEKVCPGCEDAYKEWQDAEEKAQEARYKYGDARLTLQDAEERVQSMNEPGAQVGPGEFTKAVTAKNSAEAEAKKLSTESDKAGAAAAAARARYEACVRRKCPPKKMAGQPGNRTFVARDNLLAEAVKVEDYIVEMGDKLTAADKQRYQETANRLRASAARIDALIAIEQRGDPNAPILPPEYKWVRNPDGTYLILTPSGNVFIGRRNASGDLVIEDLPRPKMADSATGGTGVTGKEAGTVTGPSGTAAGTSATVVRPTQITEPHIWITPLAPFAQGAMPDSVFKAQTFAIRVILPPGAEAPAEISVDVTNEANSSKGVTLSKSDTTPYGTLYVSQPIQIHPGKDTPSLLNNWIAVDNGGKLTATYLNGDKPAQTSFLVYDTPLAQAVARNDRLIASVQAQMNKAVKAADAAIAAIDEKLKTVSNPESKKKLEENRQKYIQARDLAQYRVNVANQYFALANQQTTHGTWDWSIFSLQYKFQLGKYHIPLLLHPMLDRNQAADLLQSASRSAAEIGRQEFNDIELQAMQLLALGLYETVANLSLAGPAFTLLSPLANWLVSPDAVEGGGTWTGTTIWGTVATSDDYADAAANLLLAYAMYKWPIVLSNMIGESIAPGYKGRTPLFKLQEAPRRTWAENAEFEGKLFERVQGLGLTGEGVRNQAGVEAFRNSATMDEAVTGIAWNNEVPAQKLMAQTGRTPVQVAQDLDRFLLVSFQVEDPVVRAQQIKNYLGKDTPRVIVDRIQAAGTSVLQPGQDVATERPMADPDAPTVGGRFNVPGLPKEPVVPPQKPAIDPRETFGLNPDPNAKAARPGEGKVTPPPAKTPIDPRETFGLNPDPNAKAARPGEGKVTPSPAKTPIDPRETFGLNPDPNAGRARSGDKPAVDPLTGASPRQQGVQPQGQFPFSLEELRKEVVDKQNEAIRRSQVFRQSPIRQTGDVSVMTPESVKQLTPEEIQRITPADIEALPPQLRNALPVETLNADQLRALNRSLDTELTGSPTMDPSGMNLNSVRPDQLSQLSDAQLRLLNSNPTGLSPEMNRAVYDEIVKRQSVPAQPWVLPCSQHGTKKLNQDQADRMMEMLFRQEQGLSLQDPSRYSDLPPMEDLTDGERGVLGAEFRLRAGQAREENKDEAARVYDSISRKLLCEPPTYRVGGGAPPSGNAPSSCKYTVNLSPISLGSQGGSGTVYVIAGAACPWTAVSNVPWITINSPESVLGSGTANIFVTPNPGDPRAGTFTIAGETVQVMQPSVAGTIALLRQLHPDWSVEELKALALGGAATTSGATTGTAAAGNVPGTASSSVTLPGGTGGPTAFPTLFNVYNSSILTGNLGGGTPYMGPDPPQPGVVVYAIEEPVPPPESIPQSPPDTPLAGKRLHPAPSPASHHTGGFLQPAAFRVNDTSALALPGAVERLLARATSSTSTSGDISFSIVSNGNSMGEAFELQVLDPSGKVKQITMPEGVVLQPLKRGSAQPVSARGGNVLTKKLNAYCLEFDQRPPEAGMLYRIAPADLQEKYKPVRHVLQAGRELARAGRFHPDGDANDYMDSIRQYALWSKLGNWDEKKFSEMFLERSKKNAQAMKVKWTKQLEQALLGLVPGRWRDISMVLQEGQRLSEAAARPGTQ